MWKVASTRWIVRFVRPGFTQIAESSSVSTLATTAAFYSAASEQLTIAGQNTGRSPVMINGQHLNLPAISSLGLYETSTSLNLQRANDVTVTGGAFTVQIPADTFFTLTNISTQIRTLPAT